MDRGAIILCGGQSKRMGRDKATLPFGPEETLLQRVARLVGQAVPSEQIVCVAAAGQSLPQLPAGLRTARDATPARGPLAGLAAGLAALKGSADAAFVCGCDMPLVKPAFVNRMFDLLGGCSIAALHDGRRWHPLTAVYRVDILPRVESRLIAGPDRSLTALLDAEATRRVHLEELQDIDPELDSLASCNTMEDYQRLLRAWTFSTIPSD